MSTKAQNTYRNDYTAGQGLPRFSTQLDSVRAYQFECRFMGLPSQQNIAAGANAVDNAVAAAGISETTDLTMAAKTVSPISMATQTIEVRRVNDKFHYPGYAVIEPVTITFDNLLLRNTAGVLWNWFRTVYDPLTGNIETLSPPGAAGGRPFKCNELQIVELDNLRNAHSYISLYGVYPQSVKFAEKNYNTNEFSTIEVEFRYDFMHYQRR